MDEIEQGDEKGECKIDHDRIVGIPQGWRLVGAIKTTERKVAGKEIVHGGSRLMEWCVGNAHVEPKGNAILITKQASGTGKIDPLMAAFNAVALMALNPSPRTSRSAYKIPKVIVLPNEDTGGNDEFHESIDTADDTGDGAATVGVRRLRLDGHNYAG